MHGQIIDTIKQAETIIIHRHVRPDPDAYGSQLGLKALLEEAYPEKRILAAGMHEPTMDFMAGPDKVEDADFEGALVIVTDTANQERVDDQRYKNGSGLIKIDHHPNDDPYGDITLVDTGASSASEMIFELYTYGAEHAGWKLTEKAARFLYAGIVGDTGRFIYPSTTQRTFEVASELIRFDFDREELYDGMYEKERNLLNLQGYIYQEFQLTENGAAYIRIPSPILSKFNVTPSETSLLVSSLGDVKGMRAWVMFIEEEAEIRVRFRSKGPIINTLAKQYGGGGHPLAAGASVYSWEEADVIVEKLIALCDTD